MIGELPTSLEVGGIQYPIRTDFRIILNIFEAFNDDELNDVEKAYVCIKCMFVDYCKIPQEHMQEAVEKAYWFCDGGDAPKQEPAKVKLLDWKHDENIIFPAINKVAGKEIREYPYMHWWTFLGLFGEVGEGLYSTVMSIRQKRAEGQKLEKWEKDFYKKNKNIIDIHSEEDKEAVKETEAFLEELLGK